MMDTQTMMDTFGPLADSQAAELAPYLAGLNVSEALEDFSRLADLVLSQEQEQQQVVAAHEHHGHFMTLASTPTAAPPAYTPPYTPEPVASPSSPGGASLYSSFATSPSMSGGFASAHWSQASSPMGSDFCSSMSSSYSTSSSSSSNSSVCGDSDDSRSSSSSSSAAGSGSRRRNSAARRSAPTEKRGCERKRQNATAAERYRRKLKGRRCGLEDELEQERQRNSKLMQSFAAKLELYREFADLLAANTRDPSRDQELARLGSRSLGDVLERICPAEFLVSNGRQRVELERLREHFKRVLGIGQLLHC